MTRISKLPQVLIIHLQRIVFNLDTFINEKITTKHEFPI
jgi:ubiquitin C-terminal hydrolase